MLIIHPNWLMVKGKRKCVYVRRTPGKSPGSIGRATPPGRWGVRLFELTMGSSWTCKACCGCDLNRSASCVARASAASLAPRNARRRWRIKFSIRNPVMPQHVDDVDKGSGAGREIHRDCLAGGTSLEKPAAVVTVVNLMLTSSLRYLLAASRLKISPPIFNRIIPPLARSMPPQGHLLLREIVGSRKLCRS